MIPEGAGGSDSRIILCYKWSERAAFWCLLFGDNFVLFAGLFALQFNAIVKLKKRKKAVRVCFLKRGFGHVKILPNG